MFCEASCGILLLAIAEEPQFLELSLHNPKSSPACQPLVSLVWHWWGFVVVGFFFIVFFSPWLSFNFKDAC